jgi:hypothetical protein
MGVCRLLAIFGQMLNCIKIHSVLNPLQQLWIFMGKGFYCDLIRVKWNGWNVNPLSGERSFVHNALAHDVLR